MRQFEQSLNFDSLATKPSKTLVKQLNLDVIKQNKYNLTVSDISRGTELLRASGKTYQNEI